MKVAMVVPYLMSSKTFLQPPVEFYTVKNMLKMDIVDIYDFRVTKHTAGEAADIVANGFYDIIVITTSPYDMCQMYHSDYRLSYAIYTIKSIVKKVQCPVILAGAHVNLFPQKIMLDTGANYAIIGEIEQTVCNIIKKLKKQKNLKDVPNLCYLDGSELRYTKYDEKVAHPNESVSIGADWSEVDFSKYFGYYYVNNKMRPHNNWGVILGSRGCPFHCNFCYNFFGNNLRFRNPANVVNELKNLKERGCEIVFFLDMILTVNKKWIDEICNQILYDKIDIKWICQTRCDCVDESLLKKMHRAGCYAIQYGVECFDNEVLKKLNKQISCEKIIDALRITRDAGIIPSAFLMVGTPFDTETSLNETIGMLEKEKIPFIPIIYTPRYGSLLGDEIIKNSLGSDWNSMLKLRGHLSQNSDLINMIKKHSIMKGESFKTVEVNFKLKDFNAISKTHRKEIECAEQITDGRKLEDYIVQPKDKEKDFVPFISFPITRTCPFKCVYCGEGGENTISNVAVTDLNTIVDLCTKAKRMGIKKVRLTGGEPMTHPQIGDILRYLSEEGFYTLVNTNGVLIEKNVDALVRTSKNIHFAVSLDTLNRNRFGWISQTAEENFDKVIKGIDLLRDLGYLMRINMVVGKFNEDEIPDMIEFCRKNHCDLKLQEIASVPYPHLKWDDIHCDFKDIEMRLEKKASKVLVHSYASKIGIPVKIYEINGVYVTLKAMYYGSRYETKEFCKNCPHYPCHEGLYDIYVLGDGSIATCRWRRYGSMDTFEKDLERTIRIFRKAQYIGHNNIKKMERISEKGNELL